MSNGEYLCEKSCNDNYPYKDAVTNPHWCVKRCPEYAYFLDIDGDNKECKTSCPTDRSYVDVNYLDDKSFVCKSECSEDYYIDELTSTSIKYCVPSCKNLIPTAFINKNGTKCVDKCEDG